MARRFHLTVLAPMFIILLVTMSSDPADANFLVRLFSFCLAVVGINAPLTRDDVMHPRVVELGDIQNKRYNLLDYVRLASCAIVRNPSID